MMIKNTDGIWMTPEEWRADSETESGYKFIGKDALRPLTKYELKNIFTDDFVKNIQNKIIQSHQTIYSDTKKVFSIPYEYIEMWFAEYLQVQAVGAGIYPIDILKPNEWGAEVKMLSCKVDEYGKLINGDSGETSLVQKFVRTGISLDDMFRNQQYLEIKNGCTSSWKEQLVAVKADKNIERIYYFFFLRGSPKESYICAFEAMVEKINDIKITKRDENNTIKEPIYLDGIINERYGNAKINKAKKRLELRLKPKNLYDDGLLITVPMITDDLKTKTIDETFITPSNFFSIKLSKEDGISALQTFYNTKNTKNSFIIDGLTQHYNKVKVNDLVFIVAGGDKGKITIEYTQGLYGVAKVINKPYEKSGNSYTIDVQFIYFFNNIIEKKLLKNYSGTIDIPNIGLMSKGEQNQAISKIDIKQAKAILDASLQITRISILSILDIFPWLREEFNPISTKSNHTLIDNLPPALNVKKIAEVFSNYLVNYNSNDTSTLIGIFGKWGRGKTYFYEKVREHIFNQNDIQKKFYFCKFQPWKYQQQESAWAYLYKTILDSYLGLGKDGFLDKLKRYYKIFQLNKLRLGLFKLSISFLSVIFTGILIFLPFVDKYNFLISFIGILGISGVVYMYKAYSFFIKSKNTAQDIINNYGRTKDYSHYLGFQNEIEKELIFLLETYIDKDSERLILFVDDLDRCNEKMIIDIMDGLRLVLDNEEINSRLTIIIAIDERILRKSIEHKYFTKDLLGSDIDTQEYIEKFFLMGLKLNQLNDNDIEELVEKYTNLLNIKNNKIKVIEEQEPSEPTEYETKDIEKQEHSEPTEYETKDIEKQDPSEPTESETKDIEKQELKEDLIYALNDNEITSIQAVLIKENHLTPRKINMMIHRYLIFKSLVLTIFDEYKYQSLNQKTLVELVVSSQKEENLKEFIDLYKNDKSPELELPLVSIPTKLPREDYIILIKFAEMVSPF